MLCHVIIMNYCNVNKTLSCYKLNHHHQQNKNNTLVWLWFIVKIN